MSSNHRLIATALYGIAGFGLAFAPARMAAAESVDPVNKGLQIAQQTFAANEGFQGEHAELTMDIVNARGEKITRRMRGRTKDLSNDGDKSIITFDWPADVKGTHMLTWSHREGDDDQWLFLPAINRVKRISSNNKSGSFMGSEFAYEDLASQEVEKYAYRFLGDETFAGRDVWKLERVPHDSRSGYSKQVLMMDKAYQNPVEIKSYDRKGALYKTATFDYERVGKFWRPKSIKVVNQQTRKWSQITWVKRKLNQKMSDGDFDPHALDAF